MKKLALALLLISAPAFADGSVLETNMKALGGLFKAIGSSVSDRGQDAANAANAAKMITLFQGVLNQVPDDISALPAPQQPAALADYQRLINAEIGFAQQLQAAFAANDNTTAANVLNKMSLDKKEGHDKYNKD